VNNGMITLGKGSGDLNLILLQPKQKSRALHNEATVTKVLMDRLGKSHEDDVATYEKLFKGKNSKNMKRLRIKVDFITPFFHYSGVSLQTIVDTGNKDIGAMDFVEAHPLSSCSRGGRRVMLVSEYPLSRSITPVWIVSGPDEEGEKERPDLTRLLVQPTEVEVRNTQVIFVTPAQPNLHCLPPLHTIKLAVTRADDGHLSNQFPWTFEAHEWGNCLQCDWDVDGMR